MNKYFSSHSIYTYISGVVVLRAGLLWGRLLSIIISIFMVPILIIDKQ